MLMSVSILQVVLKFFQVIDVFTVKADDETLITALQKYHRQLLTHNKTISDLLLADYGITMR